MDFYHFYIFIVVYFIFCSRHFIKNKRKYKLRKKNNNFKPKQKNFDITSDFVAVSLKKLILVSNEFCVNKKDLKSSDFKTELKIFDCAKYFFPFSFLVFFMALSIKTH